MAGAIGTFGSNLDWKNQLVQLAHERSQNRQARELEKARIAQAMEIATMQDRLARDNMAQEGGQFGQRLGFDREALGARREESALDRNQRGSQFDRQMDQSESQFGRRMGEDSRQFDVTRGDRNQVFDYQKSRDVVGDERYSDAQRYSRGRDTVMDDRYANERDYGRGRDAAGDVRNERYRMEDQGYRASRDVVEDKYREATQRIMDARNQREISEHEANAALAEIARRYREQQTLSAIEGDKLANEALTIKNAQDRASFNKLFPNRDIEGDPRAAPVAPSEPVSSNREPSPASAPLMQAGQRLPSGMRPRSNGFLDSIFSRLSRDTQGVMGG